MTPLFFPSTCWALSEAIEALAQLPGYQHLAPGNLKALAENHALREITKHWDRLPQGEKMAELFAQRGLRARIPTPSLCLIASLIKKLKAKKAPLSYLSSINSSVWKQLERRAQSDSKKNKLIKLNRYIASLESEIKALKRKGAL